LPVLVTVIAFWAVMVGVLIAFVRPERTHRFRSWPGEHNVGRHAGWSGERILAERYARGEIDDVEFQHRMEALRALRESGVPGDADRPTSPTTPR